MNLPRGDLFALPAANDLPDGDKNAPGKASQLLDSHQNLLDGAKNAPGIDKNLRGDLSNVPDGAKNVLFLPIYEFCVKSRAI